MGSLFAGQAADALGPKKALLLNNAWLLVGCVLCSGTPTGYWGLLAGVELRCPEGAHADVSWAAECASRRDRELPKQFPILQALIL